MDATAVDLLQFVPTPTNSGALVTAPVQPERGDQFTVKIDHRINDKQNLSIYYYFDDHHLVSPFAQFEAAGANVPVSALPQASELPAVEHQPHSGPSATPRSMNFASTTTAKHSEPSSVQCTLRGARFVPAGALVATDAFWRTGSLLLGRHARQHIGNSSQPRIKHRGSALHSVERRIHDWEQHRGFECRRWQFVPVVQTVSSKIGKEHSLKFGTDVRRQRFDQTLLF